MRGPIIAALIASHFHRCPSGIDWCYEGALRSHTHVRILSFQPGLLDEL
jgi:hypothetical protein